MLQWLCVKIIWSKDSNKLFRSNLPMTSWRFHICLFLLNQTCMKLQVGINHDFDKWMGDICSNRSKEMKMKKRKYVSKYLKSSKLYTKLYLVKEYPNTTSEIIKGSWVTSLTRETFLPISMLEKSYHYTYTLDKI